MPRKIPTFAAIRSFEATARLGRQSSAAEELGISVSAVSHQIKSLETAIGVSLFEKVGTTLELTKDGSRIFEALTQSLDQLEDIFKPYLSQSSDENLTIQVNPYFANLWLMPHLRKFSLLAPDCRIELMTTPEAPRFRAPGADLAIIRATQPPQDGHSTFLFEEYITPICAPTLLEELKPIDSVNVILAAKLISAPHFDDEWSDWFEHVGLSGSDLRMFLTVDSRPNCIQAAVSGLGWAIERRPFCDWHKARGDLVAPFSQKIRTGWSYYLNNASDALSRRDVQLFSNWIRKSLAE